jgi:hypothetical protein
VINLLGFKFTIGESVNFLRDWMVKSASNGVKRFERLTMERVLEYMDIQVRQDDRAAGRQAVGSNIFQSYGIHDSVRLLASQGKMTALRGGWRKNLTIWLNNVQFVQYVQKPGFLTSVSQMRKKETV